jgi:AcrR family transcriptional regulator
LGGIQVTGGTRSYDMTARAEAAESTRERIVEAATELFLDQWYEDVTIAAIAARARVSGQTVLNHFGGKEQLLGAVVAHVRPGLLERRHRATPGDVRSAVEALVDDYEITGDASVRMLALEERLPVLAPFLAEGRAGHREWVERMFDAPDRTLELMVATDVYAWRILRRDQRLSRDATVAAMCRIVEALLQHDDRKGSP